MKRIARPWRPKNYNGNISETFWRSATDDIQRKYGYKYDALNRLKKAFYQKPESLQSYSGGYDEELSYDANGNITRINRNGHVDAVYNPHEIDDLHFSYAPNSNQLMQVFDASFDPNGFKDEDGLGGTADSDDDYEYDSFGNLMRDQNKQIDSISYNHLNLPVKIVFANQDEINYLYDATGVKVQKSVTAGSTTNTTDYLGEFQYYDNSLNFIHHAEGYVKCTNMGQYTAFSYVYQYKDHLGNIRMNYSKNPQTGMVEIVDENHYYPFGLKHTNYNVDEKDFIKEEEILKLKVPPAKVGPYNYKYNGKEWQDELGLNFYDYGARNYDPAIGRWMNIDPLAEEYYNLSPFIYGANNPVYFVDPDGMQLDTFGVDNDGRISKIDERKYYDENGNEVDKLIVGTKVKTDRDGNIKNKNIDVKDGVLDNIQPKTGLIPDGKGGEKVVNGQSIEFGGSMSEAEKVFNFLADNVDTVEFSLVNESVWNTNQTISSVHTSFSAELEAFGSRRANQAALKGRLLSHHHSHPYTDIERDYSDDDQDFKTSIQKSIDFFKEKTGKTAVEPKFYLRKNGKTTSH